MADYIFNRYRDESLGYPSSLNLYGVRLVLQKAELTSFETGSSEVTWTYTIKEENHQYYPETNVFVPFDLSGTGLKNYAWDNRNSFFPPDLIGKAWINAPIYKAGFHTVELTTSALLPRSQRERNSPKPPDRWVIEFDFEDGHRVCPSYEDLITGYSRDKRFIPDKLKITSSINQEVKVEYYRSNPYEQIPNLEYIDPEANFVESTYDAIDITKSRMRSIDWHVMELQLVANRAATIDIAGIVLGTLRINSPNLLIVGHSDINETLYPAKYLLNNISYLDELFNNWSLLYNDEYIRQISLNYLLECQATDRKLRFSYTGLGFNSSIVSVAITEGFNNYWNNYQLFNYSDYLCNPRMNRQFKIQVLNYHPFFKSLPLAGFDGFINIDQTLFLDTKRRIFDKCNQNYYSFNHANLIKWQLKPQIDRQNNSRGIGAIAMDSPRVIEIHKALDAQKYSENDVEPSEPRVSNLGWHINRQSEILGIKVRADGTIDKDLARKQVRTVIDKATRLDPDKVGVGNFGEEQAHLLHGGRNAEHNASDEHPFPRTLN